MQRSVKAEDGCRGTKLLLFSKGNIFSLWVGNILFLFSKTPVNRMIQYKRAHMCALLYIHTLKYFIGHALCLTKFPDCVFYALPFSWNVIQCKLQGSSGWKVRVSGLRDQQCQMNQLIVQWNSNAEHWESVSAGEWSDEQMPSINSSLCYHIVPHMHTNTVHLSLYPFTISLCTLTWLEMIWVKRFCRMCFGTPYWSNSNKYALIVHYMFRWVLHIKVTVTWMPGPRVSQQVMVL